jgi:hypothetical protein
MTHAETAIAIASEATQTIRTKYRSRVENKLEPFQLAAMLAQRAPAGTTINVVAIDAATIANIAKQIAALALKSCNYGMNERDEKRWERLKGELVPIAKGYGLTVTTNGDVRGYVVRLHGDDIYRNGWGDGFGVA